MREKISAAFLDEMFNFYTTRLAELEDKDEVALLLVRVIGNDEEALVDLTTRYLNVLKTQFYEAFDHADVSTVMELSGKLSQYLLISGDDEELKKIALCSEAVRLGYSEHFDPSKLVKYEDLDKSELTDAVSQIIKKYPERFSSFEGIKGIFSEAAKQLLDEKNGWVPDAFFRAMEKTLKEYDSNSYSIQEFVFKKHEELLQENAQLDVPAYDDVLKNERKQVPATNFEPEDIKSSSPYEQLQSGEVRGGEKYRIAKRILANPDYKDLEEEISGYLKESLLEMAQDKYEPILRKGSPTVLTTIEIEHIENHLSEAGVGIDVLTPPEGMKKEQAIEAFERIKKEAYLNQAKEAYRALVYNQTSYPRNSSNMQYWAKNIANGIQISGASITELDPEKTASQIIKAIVSQLEHISDEKILSFKESLLDHDYHNCLIDTRIAIERDCYPNYCKEEPPALREDASPEEKELYLTMLRTANDEAAAKAGLTTKLNNARRRSAEVAVSMNRTWEADVSRNPNLQELIRHGMAPHRLGEVGFAALIGGATNRQKKLGTHYDNLSIEQRIEIELKISERFENQSDNAPLDRDASGDEKQAYLAKLQEFNNNRAPVHMVNELRGMMARQEDSAQKSELIERERRKNGGSNLPGH